MNRREFLGGGAAMCAALAGCKLTESAGRPLMRLGVMTDTHVGSSVESCSRVRAAFELFRNQGADLVINNGDIADHFNPEGYALYRQVFDEVYAGQPKPREIFVYAWHDAFCYRGQRFSDVASAAPAAFEDVRLCLRAQNPHTDVIEFRGYAFLVMPQFIGSPGFISFDEYERRVAAACAAHPGKPVFVIDHVPPYATVYNSCNWGEERRRKILDKYPQAVVFSGHVHGSLRNDAMIWQDAFTVINAGCLQKWSGLFPGSPWQRKDAYAVLSVDVCADRLLIRRWDVRDGREINPKHPWIVPLPFAAETAPYNRPRLVAREVAPRFPAGTTLQVEAEGHPFAGFRLAFPEVADGVMQYRISAARKQKDGWEDFCSATLCSEFWKHPKDRTGRSTFLMDDRLFDPGVSYRLSVAPVGQYGAVGKPIVAEVTAPADFQKTTVTYVSENPMRELVFTDVNGERPGTKDGFYGPLAPYGCFLALPATAFSGGKDASFVVTLDMRTRIPDPGRTFTVKVLDFPRGKALSDSVLTPGGDSGAQRYVLEVKGPVAEDEIGLWFDRGDPSRIRFERIRIERLEK